MKTRVTAAIFRCSPVLFLLLAAACGGNRNTVPNNVGNPDKFLYDRGTTALNDRKWTDAREYFRPVGVVGVIAPWNFPLILGITDALAALAAGCGVVVKLDSRTPFTALWAATLLDKSAPAHPFEEKNPHQRRWKTTSGKCKRCASPLNRR